MKTQTDLPEYKHFELIGLADGVYAAIAKPDGMAACNSGIIDLGDRTVVIDTFLSPDAASDLQDAAEKLTGRPVGLVLITHHHFDHIWGNQVFDEKTCIFSSEEAYRVIVETGEESLKANKESAAMMLQDYQQKLKAAGDVERGEIEKTLKMIQARLDLIDTIRLRPPSLTCQGPMTFYGNARKIEFIPYEKGHSPGNAVIYLPEDGVIFVGDLLFARHHPFVGDGDPDGWIRVLKKIEELEPDVVVPGHGGMSTVEEIKLMAEYIQVVKERVLAFIEAGKAADALHEIKIPEPFDSWEPRDLLMRTLNGLYEFYA